MKIFAAFLVFQITGLVALRLFQIKTDIPVLDHWVTVLMASTGLT